jgi:hypothetical protein
MTGWLILAVIVVGALIVFGNRATRPTPTPGPTPGPLPVDNPPIVFAPGVLSWRSHVTIGEAVSLDLRHRQAGCDAAGTPTLEYGAWDPDGKFLNYWLECDGPSSDGSARIPYGIFNNYGKRIDRRWLTPGSQDTFAVDRQNAYTETLEAVAQCKVFVGHNNPVADYAMKGCTPEPKLYECPNCHKKETYATIESPRCSGCGTVMQVYIESNKDVIGTMKFAWRVSDGKYEVPCPGLEFTVHRACRAS